MAGHRYTMLAGAGSGDEGGTEDADRYNPRASSEEELWMTADAMQTAADTMIAATETFRRQLSSQGGTALPTPPPGPFQPYRPDDVVGFNPDAPGRRNHRPREAQAPLPPLPSQVPSVSNSTSSHHSSAGPQSSSSSSRSNYRSLAVAVQTPTPVVPGPATASFEQFMPRKASRGRMPPLDTNFHAPLASAGRPGLSVGGGETVDVDISLVANRTIRAGESSTTNWSGTGSTATVTLDTAQKKQGPVARHAELVTASEEHYRRGSTSHPNPLNSHPSGSSPNSQTEAIGATVRRVAFDSPASEQSAAGGPNYSTYSLASTQHLGSSPVNNIRDSVDDLNAPLFPRAAYGGTGYGPYGPHGTSGGISRNALSRSFRRATAHMPRLGSSLANVEPVTEKAREPQPQPVHPSLGKVQKFLFVLVICLADGLVLAGISQGIAPMFDIIADFPDTEMGGVMWFTAAYALTAGAFVLPGARLGGVFGPKRVLVLGFMWFSLWSLVAGFGLAAQRAGGNGNVFFVFSRAMQGIGPGLILPNGQVLVGKVLPAKEDKSAFKMSTILFGAAAPTGFVVGAVMSALFAANASWPWAFWVMAAVCLASSGLALLAVPSTPVNGRDKDNDGLFAILDVPAAALLLAGLVLLDAGWNEATTCGWQTPYTYFLAIIGTLVLGGFIYVERHAYHPIIPLARMGASTAIILFVVFCGWMAWSVWVVYAFRFLQEHRQLSPLMASAQVADFALLGLIGSLAVAFLFQKSSVKACTMLVAGMLAFLVPSILMATAPVAQTYWENVFIATLFVPLGMELSTPAATAMLEQVMPHGETESAPWLVMMTINYAISIGLGVAGTAERSIGEEGARLLPGIRAGQWTGAGIAGLGLLVAVALAVARITRGKRARRPASGV